MTRVLRTAGNVLVWLLAVLGVASVGVWGATQLGWIKPLIVISGSMEPGIMTGDLLIARPHPAADLKVGQVASIRSTVTGEIITHRVVAVEAQPDGTWHVNLKGDANDSQDGETYVLTDTVWQPVLQVPGGGSFIVTLTKPTVAIPLGVTILALLGLTLLSGGAQPDRRAPGRHAGGTAGTDAAQLAPQRPPHHRADPDPGLTGPPSTTSRTDSSP